MPIHRCWQVDARVRGSLAAAREAFGPRGLVLLSNSAGLEQYDPHGGCQKGLAFDFLNHALAHPPPNSDPEPSIFHAPAELSASATLAAAD